VDDILDLLDRQFAALSSQTGSADFLVSVTPFLGALTAEPRIAVHMQDLREETLNRVRVLEELDDALVSTLTDLRRRFEETLRDVPVTDRDPSENDGPDSFSNFDAVASAPPQPLNYRGDGARSPRLLSILQGWASTESFDLPEAWTVELYNAQVQWDHGSRRLSLEMKTSAGLALLRLDAVPPALNPDPVFRQVGEDRRARLEQLLLTSMSVGQQLFFAVHTNEGTQATRALVDSHVTELRAGLTRLSTELHRRVGTTRSRQALISRFKQRSEWHDASRLRVVAAQDDLGGHPEDRLTAELARYLFDQGLNPLTKPTAAGLEPDLLDPAVSPPFYVEAKQYSGPDRQGIIRALRQILDTVGRLRSDSLPITEAFCVVFRRGGPRYLLPDAFEADGYRIFFTLVDIAPADVSGRRQRHAPSAIALGELVEVPLDNDQRH
jgi:hypothetical protein